jgi:hypothetical protein
MPAAVRSPISHRKLSRAEHRSNEVVLVAEAFNMSSCCRKWHITLADWNNEMDLTRFGGSS